MNHTIDINDRARLKEILHGLDTGTAPLWGKMTARQMVEHLAEQVRWSNGKKKATCDQPAEAAANSKQKMIYTDAAIPKNIFLETLPEQYACENIDTAIDQLMAELDEFDCYFKAPGVAAVHSGFGPMNQHEWLIWHGKHFTHHLVQFGLIPTGI